MSVTRSDYIVAQAKVNNANSLIDIQTRQIAKQQQLLASSQAAGINNTASQEAIARAEQQLAAARAQLAANSAIVSQFENQTTVPPQSVTVTEEKYEASIGFNEETATLPDDSQSGIFEQFDTPTIKEIDDSVEYGTRTIRNVPRGAERLRTESTKFIFRDVSGKKLGNDLRVKIRVPQNYWTKLTTGMDNELKTLQGIIFPYTPSISTEFGADYTALTPLHSNFPINFYQRSKVGDISVTGKFTVENTSDAVIYLATVHLLRALTRMRSGGKTGDTDSGSPPPVCRFDAYGEMMYSNIPVVIKSFRFELPDGVDFFTIKGTDAFGPTSVPTLSTIAVTLTPMYSRNEMQKFSVTNYIQSNNFKKGGYL